MYHDDRHDYEFEQEYRAAFTAWKSARSKAQKLMQRINDGNSQQGYYRATHEDARISRADYEALQKLLEISQRGPRRAE